MTGESFLFLASAVQCFSFFMPQIEVSCCEDSLYVTRCEVCRLQDLAGPGGQVPKVGRKCFAGRTVFVAGANGRLGSRVVRMLLRRGCRVRAAVRGTEKVEDYSRLSYEIGAEEGLGDIQAPWVRKSVEMTATEEMKEYGLGQLIVVECDLMDEKNVARAVKGVDAVVFCAGSFDRGRLAVSLHGHHLILSSLCTISGCSSCGGLLGRFKVLHFFLDQGFLTLLADCFLCRSRHLRSSHQTHSLG